MSTVCRAFAVILCLFSLAAAQEEEKAPQLVFGETAYNFGTVAQGTVVEHKFELENRGTAPLKITKIDPSCGCTAAVSDLDVVPPGSKGGIKVSLDTSGFQGEKIKTVRVYTDDPRAASSLLIIKGTIEADVEAKPFPINFGEVRAGTRVSTEGAVVAKPESGVKINDIEARADELELTLGEASANARKFTLTLKETAPVGDYHGKLLVKTTSQKNPVLAVPVLAQVEGDLVLSPRVVSFAADQEEMKGVLTKEVTLTNRGSGKIAVTGIESDNQAVDAEYSVLEEGKRYLIKVSVKPGSSSIIQARVKVSTDNPVVEQGQVTFPVYAIILKPEK